MDWSVLVCCRNPITLIALWWSGNQFWPFTKHFGLCGCSWKIYESAQSLGNKNTYCWLPLKFGFHFSISNQVMYYNSVVNLSYKSLPLKSSWFDTKYKSNNFWCKKLKLKIRMCVCKTYYRGFPHFVISEFVIPAISWCTNFVNSLSFYCQRFRDCQNHETSGNILVPLLVQE